MTRFDVQPEDEVREDTIEDLLEANNLADLKEMRQDMLNKLDVTDDEREADLLKYRMGILEEAIDWIETND
jgi:hypothetical protein